MINGNKYKKADYKLRIKQHNDGIYASQLFVYYDNEEKVLLDFISDGLPTIAIYTFAGQVAITETMIEQPEKKPVKPVNPVLIKRI